jgi:hypothetical protein
VSVSVISANTCPPPKAAAYSASATDATTTGMRWQKAWRGALWGVVVGGEEGWCDWMRRGARVRDSVFRRLCLSVTVWGWIEEVRGRVFEANRTASYAARVRSEQEAGVGTAPESHGGWVNSFLGVGVRRDIVEKAVSGGKV